MGRLFIIFKMPTARILFSKQALPGCILPYLPTGQVFTCKAFQAGRRHHNTQKDAPRTKFISRVAQQGDEASKLLKSSMHQVITRSQFCLGNLKQTLMLANPCVE